MKIGYKKGTWEKRNFFSENGRQASGTVFGMTQHKKLAK